MVTLEGSPMEAFLVPLLAVVFIGLIAVVILVARQQRGDRSYVTGLPPPRRKLPVLIECGTCKHFDLEEGQAFIAQHPAFVAAAAVRSPAQMSKHAELD